MMAELLDSPDTVSGKMMAELLESPDTASGPWLSHLQEKKKWVLTTKALNEKSRVTMAFIGSSFTVLTLSLARWWLNFYTILTLSLASWWLNFLTVLTLSLVSCFLKWSSKKLDWNLINWKMIIDLKVLCFSLELLLLSDMEYFFVALR